MNFKEFEQLFEFENQKGFTEEEIAKCEKRLGIKLPTTLRNLYLKYGKDDLLNSHHYFVTPNNLNFYSSDWLSIYYENQAVCGWAINKNELSRPKCKVYCFHDDLQYIEDDSIENFLVKLGFYYSDSIFRYGVKSKFRVEDEKVLIKKFGEPQSEVEYPKIFFYQYYWNLDVFICVGGHYGKKYLCAWSKNENEIKNFQLYFSTRNWEILPDKTGERKNKKRLIRFDDEILLLQKEKGSNNEQITKRDEDLPF